MSWIDYLHYITPVLDQAFIFDHSKNQILASTQPLQTYTIQLPDYHFIKEEDHEYDEQQELQHLIKYSYPQHPAGVRIFNTKYLIVSQNDNLFYLKSNIGGACLVITDKLAIFGSYDISKKTEDGQQQNAYYTNKKIENAGNLLKESGY